MKIKLTLAVVVLALLAACGCAEVKSTDSGNSQATPVNSATPAPSVAASPTPSPTPSPTETPVSVPVKKEDDSARAVGTHKEGRLLVKPVDKAFVVPLGAPSCLGMETDLNWTGTYEAVWEPASGGTPGKVFTFPADFEIIQRNDTPVEMKAFTLNKTDMFAYVPRYTDCHAQETYFFGIGDDGGAFPITFEMKPGVKMDRIDQYTHRSVQVTQDELIITGGLWAGQNLIDVYHFRYDAKKHAMILQKTEQFVPNKLPPVGESDTKKNN